MVSKKHILFIVENNSVPHDVRVWREAQTVRKFGYAVSVISPKKYRTSPKFEVINDIPIYRHRRPYNAEDKFGLLVEYANALFWEIYLSFKIFLKKPFHCIHAANPPDHIFLIALLFRIFGVKYIFDHHDIASEMYLAKYGKADILYRILTFVERVNLKIADIVISTNESYKKFAVAKGPKEESDVFVVRNGPDLSQITFMPPNNSLKNGFDYLVAYVGVIGAQEGIDHLLRAVDYIVNRKIHNTKFIIIGKGPNWQKMVDLSRELKITQFVEFTGYISYEKLYEILASSDLCVNPEFRNGFTDKSTMIKIMDYMSFGKPIVQFYTKEGHVTAGDSAFYVYENDEVTLAKSIISLLADPEKRQKMGAIGKQRIEKDLCWDKQKLNLFRAYEHVENKVQPRLAN